MAHQNNFWYHLLFKLKLHESEGNSFQNLVNDLFDSSVSGFQSIQPWGNSGDGGNDGWVSDRKEYYQVHGPKSGKKVSVLDVVKKSTEDFQKLTESWGEINRYFFVHNDHFNGVPAPVAKALEELKDEHSLEVARCIDSRELTRLFMALPEERKQMLVGGVPSTIPDAIDSSMVGEMLSHLADTPDLFPKLLDELPPDFENKIELNGITEPVSSFLRSYSFHSGIVDDFLIAREEGLGQGIAKEIKELYELSVSLISNDDDCVANLRYVFMVEKLIPPNAKQHPHSLKAYREAAQIIISKYFETCDAYEHPKQLATA